MNTKNDFYPPWCTDWDIDHQFGDDLEAQIDNIDPDELVTLLADE